MAKKSNLKKLKKKAWELLSKCIRLEASDTAGYVICYTCGKKLPWKKMQAGHGFSGRGNAILLEEKIIRPQGYGCNICNSGKLDIFIQKLRTELGDKEFEILWKQKHTIRKFTINELEEIIMNYEIRLKKLMIKKGMM